MFTSVDSNLRTLKLSELSVLIEDINYNFSVLRSHPMFQGVPGKPGEGGNPGSPGTRGSRWLFIYLDAFKSAFSPLEIDIISKDDITFDWLNRQVSYNSGYTALCNAFGIYDFVESDIVVLSTSELIEFTYNGGRQFKRTGVSINKDYGYITEDRVKDLIEQALGGISDKTTISRYLAYIRNFPDGTFGVNSISGTGGGLDTVPGTSEAIESKEHKFFSYVPDALTGTQTFIFGNKTDYSKLVNGAIDPAIEDPSSYQITNEYSPGEYRTAAAIFMQDNYYNGIIIGHKNGEYIKQDSWNKNFKQFSRMFMSHAYNKNESNYTDTKQFGLHITSGYGKRLYKTTSPAEYSEIFIKGPYLDNNNQSTTGIDLIAELVSCMQDLKVLRNLSVGGGGTFGADLHVAGTIHSDGIINTGPGSFIGSFSVLDKSGNIIFKTSKDKTEINSTEINFKNNAVVQGTVTTSGVTITSIKCSDEELLNTSSTGTVRKSKYSVNNSQQSYGTSTSGIQKPLYTSDTSKLLLEYKLTNIINWVEAIIIKVREEIDNINQGIDTSISDIKNKVDELKNQINRIETDFVSKLATINNKLADIELKLQDYLNKINANTAAIESLKARFERHITDSDTKFKNLDNKFANYDSKIEKAKLDAIKATESSISNLRDEVSNSISIQNGEITKIWNEIEKLGGNSGGTTENTTVEPLKTGTVIEIFTLRKTGESDRDMLARLIDLSTLKGKVAAEIIVPIDNKGGTKTRILDLSDYIFCGGTDVFANDDSTSKVPNYSGKVVIGGGFCLNQTEYASIKNQFLTPDKPVGSYSFNIDSKYLLNHTHSVSAAVVNGTLNPAGSHTHLWSGNIEESGKHTHFFRYKRDMSSSGIGAVLGANGVTIDSQGVSPILDGDNGTHVHVVTGQSATVENHTHEFIAELHSHTTNNPSGANAPGANKQEIVPFSLAVFKFMYIGEFITTDFALKNHEHTQYALKNHTHNYAGSASVGGPANTALRLNANVKINISGAITGSADFDGSKAITINTSVSHTHNYAASDSAGGAANSLKNGITIKFGGTSETFNGSSPKTITITPRGIGAAESNHNHIGTEVVLGQYSKPDSYSAITGTDNIIIALGKLDKRIDGVESGESSGTVGILTLQKNDGSEFLKFNGSSSITKKLTPNDFGAASAGHTHSGSTITLTGYAPGITGDLSANDNVLRAFSKLNTKISNIINGGVTTSGTLTINNGETTIKFNGGTSQTVSIDNALVGASNIDNSKLYIVGTQSQSTTTGKSNYRCYIGSDNCLYSNSTKVSVEGHTHNYSPVNHNHDGRYVRSDTSTSQSTQNITITGTFIAKAFYTSSDARLKKNIDKLSSNELSASLRLKGYKFTVYCNKEHSDNGVESYGVLAHQVPKELERVVFTDSEGFKRVNYEALHSVQITALNEENKKLKKELREIKSLLEKLLKQK